MVQVLPQKSLTFKTPFRAACAGMLQCLQVVFHRPPHVSSTEQQQVRPQSWACEPHCRCMQIPGPGASLVLSQPCLQPDVFQVELQLAALLDILLGEKNMYLLPTHGKKCAELTHPLLVYSS